MRSFDLPDDFVPGNQFDKYRSRNPVHRWMMNGFLATVRQFVAQSEPRSILEIGCGPGDLAERVVAAGDVSGRRVEYVGIDVSGPDVEAARARLPQFDFREASAYDLPFEDGSFDLVLACEVFEHLQHPGVALAEAWRVCRSTLVLSVPREPLWRALNVLRGKYLPRLGNTPGHVQNFSRRSIRELVESRFAVVEERCPLPWTVLLARRLEQASVAGEAGRERRAA